MDRHATDTATDNAADSQLLALLLAALDAVDTTQDLIDRIRQTQTLVGERRELRGAADMVDDTRKLLQSLLVVYGHRRAISPQRI
jgi:hypothetical protein